MNKNYDSIKHSINNKLLNIKDNWFLPLKEDLLLLMLSVNSISNGLFIFDNEGQANNKTLSYDALVEIMPTDVWATLFLVIGLMVLSGALFVKDAKTKAYILIVAGFVGFILWTLYSLIGVEFGTSGITPIRNMAFSVIHLILGCIQIIEIWRINLQKKTIL